MKNQDVWEVKKFYCETIIYTEEQLIEDLMEVNEVDYDTAVEQYNEMKEDNSIRGALEEWNDSDDFNPDNLVYWDYQIELLRKEQ